MLENNEVDDEIPQNREEISTFKHTKHLTFFLHGLQHSVSAEDVDPNLTLNEYLRNYLHLTGTKYMCYEGGCGSCIVAATFKHPLTGVKQTVAVNSCLVTLFSCQGWDIHTIEHLGNRSDGYHELQQKIVQFNATQCGFCTPGMIMNMYALQESGKMTMAEIEDSFGGNICRCTGYRPILSAFKSMATDSDESILGIVPDIEELTICKNSPNCQQNCTNPCNSLAGIPLLIDSFGVNEVNATPTWYKVYKVEEIFAIFRQTVNRNRTYKLIAGNTAKGVFSDMRDADYYINISEVKELVDYSHGTAKLILGGNMTLTDVMKVFSKVANDDAFFEHLKTIVNHLDLVATVPVRNIGTIAGNLSMKHKHNEFPSDIFLILETLNARLILDNGKKQEVVTPQEYLNNDMYHKIIRRVEIPAFDKSYRVETYKIMPRAQNTHAFVNAGFRFKLNKSNVVQDVAIVYGTINSDFVHATQTEKYIKGKKLFDNNNMQSMFAKLNNELHPEAVYPDPSPEYRKTLAIALLYKFILSIAPDNLLSAGFKSGKDKLTRAAVSNGVQEYKTNKSLYPIGEPISKVEARDQASGEAKYITDFHDLPNQTFAAFVFGEAPAGAILKKIDASKALAVSGVERFFQASDIEGVNSFLSPDMKYFFFYDEPIFVAIGDTLAYYNQPIGMIVAQSRSIARTASRLVEAQYKMPTQSPILTVREVLDHDMKDRINELQTLLPKKQDLNAKVQFDGKFDSWLQYHYHMELQVVNVKPDDDGGFLIYPATQWLDAIQSSICRALKVPAHKITITTKRVGGAYGARITRSNHVAVAATLAAQKLRKPVKFYMDLPSNMHVIGMRTPVTANYKVGVDPKGTIGFLDTEIYINTGAYGNAQTNGFILELFNNTYGTDAFQTEISWVRTDLPATTLARAPGSFEGCAIIEHIMEHISVKLDVDPIDVRLANLNVQANPLLKKLIDDCLSWSNYRKRRADIDAYNKVNVWRKRGIAIVPMTYSLLFLGTFYAQISIYQTDGSVAITHGGVEIGQGINTKASQVVAHIFGIDMKMVHVKPTNDFVTPNNFTTGGSITTECACRALLYAGEALKKRIDDAATAKNLPKDATWLTKVQNAYAQGVSLTQNNMFTDNPDDSATYKIYGVAVAEVELDVLTGTYIIERVDIIEDTGDSLNPALDIGQIEGAFTMGVGAWTTEQIIYDTEGVLQTYNTWNYKPPGAKDIPVDFRVKLPDGIPNPKSPFKNKATSEPPCCLSVCVPLAIRHALRTVRLQANPKADPWVSINGPTTIEEIFLYSLHDYKQYKL